MALQIWKGEVIHVVPHHHFHGKIGKKGRGRSGSGSAERSFCLSLCDSGNDCPACDGSAGGKCPVGGVFLLALYAIGHSVLLVLAGTSYGVVERWISDPKYAKVSDLLRNCWAC